MCIIYTRTCQCRKFWRPAATVALGVFAVRKKITILGHLE